MFSGFCQIFLLYFVQAFRKQARLVNYKLPFRNIWNYLFFPINFRIQELTIQTMPFWLATLSSASSPSSPSTTPSLWWEVWPLPASTSSSTAAITRTTKRMVLKVVTITKVSGALPKIHHSYTWPTGSQCLSTFPHSRSTLARLFSLTKKHFWNIPTWEMWPWWTQDQGFPSSKRWIQNWKIFLSWQISGRIRICQATPPWLLQPGVNFNNKFSWQLLLKSWTIVDISKKV